MLRIPHCLDSRLTDDSKLVSPTHQPHFTPQKHSGTHFCYRLSKSQGLIRPELLSGLKPTTFRLVALCLNHYATTLTINLTDDRASGAFPKAATSKRTTSVTRIDVCTESSPSGCSCTCYWQLHYRWRPLRYALTLLVVS
jgi:hypothetical protein